jgi:hypothetical protein
MSSEEYIRSRAHTQPSHEEEPRHPERTPAAQGPLADRALAHDYSSPNSTARAGAVQRMQQTHGNKAVQRYVGGSETSALSSIQRWPSWHDIGQWFQTRHETPQADQDAIGRVGAGHGTASGASATTDVHATRPAATAARAQQGEDLMAMINNVDNERAFANAANAFERSTDAAHGAERLGRTFGGSSRLGQGLNAANYAMQYAQNMSQGQSRGEALSGALPGAAFGNWVGGHLLERSRAGGIADLAINLTHNALQAGGAPSEVTDVSGLVASATPSSFGQSVVSNAGRGLYNGGVALATGDTSGLRRQGEDIVHGRSGAPLQGYGELAQLAHHAATDRRDIDVSMGHLAGEGARRGDYGVTARVGTQLGDDWFNMIHRPGGMGVSLGEAWQGAGLAARDAGNFLTSGDTWRGAGNAIASGASRAWNATSNAVSQGAQSLAHDWGQIAERPLASLSEAGQGAMQAGRDLWGWLGRTF